MRVLLLIILSLFSLHTMGQGSLKIVVKSDKGEAVSGADVILKGEKRIFEKTDKKGHFEFKELKKGSYTLTIFNHGFETINTNIEISDQPVIQEFTLTPLIKTLDEITVKTEKENEFGIARLRNVEGTEIYAGKKNEVIILDNVNANLATNNSRQIYSKVTGLNIWESDGAGIQLGIGGRGLSPNRVSNFNTRQNGYDISADALGYPESYYSPPAEAVERIEIVRGAASLQYGTQFGGFINFRLRKGPEDKPLQVVARQTVGSFGLLNSFISAGGTKNNFNYYGFFQHKQGNGWRENSSFNVNAGFTSLTWFPVEKLSLTLEYTHMSYVSQQPGGLTDMQFENNPRQSFRERNWFRVNWNLAALIADYTISYRSKINSRTFGLAAGRDALGFLGLINRVDPLKERDLLMDQYRNFGNETRFIHRYALGKQQSIFLIGARYYQGHTERKQGNANSGYGPDFQYLNPLDLEHSHYTFPSRNIAVFTENIFQLSEKLSITPGLRYEYISTHAEGYFNEEYRDLADNIIFKQKVEECRTNMRSFVLGGVGISYRYSPAAELYGNVSQNYRSINFNDMRIVNPNFRVDPNLRDEKGYSFDAGVRGSARNKFHYEANIFMISYNDRIGSVLLTDTVLYNIYRYRTNISDSKNIGIETFVEADLLKFMKPQSKSSLSVFSNFTLLDARYINSIESAYENKRVELVPQVILKTGLCWKWNNFQASAQYSFTGEQFTDATNAVLTSNAVNGIIPAYYTADLSLSYNYKMLTVFTGINNATNNLYFTRRADGYPGPGIIPAEGRSFYLTLQGKF